MQDTTQNPNGLTNTQISQGYSTIPGNFSPITGQPTGNGQSLGLSAPNAGQINNTPVNPTPDATSLTKVTPAVIPPTSQGTSNAANAAIGASQGALLGLQNGSLQNAENAYNSSVSQTTGLINQYLGKGNEQLSMEQAAGVPQLQSLSNSLNNQYLTQGAAYNSQYNAILNNPNMTREQAAQQISDLQQQHGYDLTNTAIQASITSTNYTNAENIINHQIELKYAPIKDAIDYGMQFVTQNKDLLSAAQTRQFNSQLQVQQQTYDQGVYNSHLIQDTQVQMIKDAAAQGADQKTLDAMGQIMTSGGTIGDVATASNGYLQQGSYQPVQTGFDPNTGLPIYSGFNSKTGQLEVKNGGNVLGTTGSSDTTITGADGNGYQMGASTTMGAYASATQTQVNNIKATTAKIASTVGNITDANSAQLAINAVAKGSPITGAMVIASANKYGVDPATLIGVMQAETQCGTDGSAGSRGNNFGNVGNTDFKMKTGQSVDMKTAQDGIDACAKNLAQRKVQPGQNDPAQSTSTQNLTPDQVAAQSVKNAPAFIQPAMSTVPGTGAVYIDQGKVPKGMEIVSTNYSAKTGIPILTSAEVSDLKTVSNAIQNVVNTIAPAWDTVSQTNTGMRIWKNLKYNKSEKIFDTPYYQARNAYDSNQESLAQQVKALSGSSPRLGLLETAISALPNTKSDTRADGIAKLQRTVDLLSETVKTYIPNAQSIQLPTAVTQKTYTVNGTNYTVGKDGLYYPTR